MGNLKKRAERKNKIESPGPKILEQIVVSRINYDDKITCARDSGGTATGSEPFVGKTALTKPLLTDPASCPPPAGGGAVTLAT